jgi:hypothetical protein
MGHVNNAATWEPVEDELDRRGRVPVRAEVEYPGAIEPRDGVELRSALVDDELRLWLLVDGAVRATAVVLTRRARFSFCGNGRSQLWPPHRAAPGRGRPPRTGIGPVAHRRRRAGLMTGTSAGVLQLLHPGLGAGVTDHSAFFTEPWARILRSIPQIWGTIFATDADDGDTRGRAIRDLHPDIKASTTRAGATTPSTPTCSGGPTPPSPGSSSGRPSSSSRCPSPGPRRSSSTPRASPGTAATA